MIKRILALLCLAALSAQAQTPTLAAVRVDLQKPQQEFASRTVQGTTPVLPVVVVSSGVSWTNLAGWTKQFIYAPTNHAWSVTCTNTTTAGNVVWFEFTSGQTATNGTFEAQIFLRNPATGFEVLAGPGRITLDRNLNSIAALVIDTNVYWRRGDMVTGAVDEVARAMGGGGGGTSTITVTAQNGITNSGTSSNITLQADATVLRTDGRHAADRLVAGGIAFTNLNDWAEINGANPTAVGGIILSHWPLANDLSAGGVMSVGREVYIVGGTNAAASGGFTRGAIRMRIGSTPVLTYDAGAPGWNVEGQSISNALWRGGTNSLPDIDWGPYDRLGAATAVSNALAAGAARGANALTNPAAFDAAGEAAAVSNALAAGASAGLAALPAGDSTYTQAVARAAAAYGWGNHAGLYDAAGLAAAVSNALAAGAAAGLASLPRDGTLPMYGNLDMGTHSITNVGTNTIQFADGGHAVRSTEGVYTNLIYLAGHSVQEEDDPIWSQSSTPIVRRDNAQDQAITANTVEDYAFRSSTTRGMGFYFMDVFTDELGVETNRDCSWYAGTRFLNYQYGKNFTIGMRFDTDIVDDSTNHFSLTAHGSAQISTYYPKVGVGCLELAAASSGYVSFPDDPQLEPSSKDWTVSTWFYSPQASGASYECILEKHNTSGYTPFAIMVYNGHLSVMGTLSESTWDINVTSANTITNSTWTHLCVVRRGNLYSMYINGQLDVNSQSVSGALEDTAEVWEIGRFMSGWNWNGYLDNFTYTVGVAEYTNSFTPSEMPLWGSNKYNGSVLTSTYPINLGGVPASNALVQVWTTNSVASTDWWVEVSADAGTNYTRFYATNFVYESDGLSVWRALGPLAVGGTQGKLRLDSTNGVEVGWDNYAVSFSE